MVKVLENQLIDLELMPGLKPADLYAQATALESKGSPEKAEALRKLAAARAESLAKDVERKTAGVPLSLPLGQQPQAGEEMQEGRGGVVGAVEGVGMGLLGTIGAVGKGVGDTLGNTVYALGSGLVGTGKGVGDNLAKTGKAIVPVGEPTKDGKVPVVVVDADKAAEVASPTSPTSAEKKGPRKIELRGSKEKEAEEKEADEAVQDERLAAQPSTSKERLPSPSAGRFEPQIEEVVNDMGVGVWVDPESDTEGAERGRDTAKGDDGDGLKVDTKGSASRSVSQRSGRMEDFPDEPKILRVQTDSPNEGKWQGIRFAEKEEEEEEKGKKKSDKT